jgi:hypothetical protein
MARKNRRINAPARVARGTWKLANRAEQAQMSREAEYYRALSRRMYAIALRESVR